MLIQSDFAEYQILDLSIGTTSPFYPPGQITQPNLDASLSPSKHRIFLLINDGNIVLSNLITGEILDTLNLTAMSSIFQPELALQEVKSTGILGSDTDRELLALIDKTHQDSIMSVRWYQSDRYWLLPCDTSTTSTSLSLYDLENNSINNLESQPGLVEDYWVGPGKENILLKKGYINETRFWQEDRYYVLNINNLTVQSIALPDDVDAPSLFWVSPDSIGIIHKLGLVGGENFSVFDLHSGELQQIITGSFTYIRPYNDGFLILKENQEENTTSVSLTNTLGETTTEKTLDDRCFYKGMLNKSLLLNCQSESYLLDQNLNLTPFGDVISILSLAPDASYTIIVNRKGTVMLLDQSTMIQKPTVLEELPLEVCWLPDSSGFLYRTGGKLFHYDLINEESQHLLTSDFLGDYQNLNAIWIKSP